MRAKQSTRFCQRFGRSWPRRNAVGNAGVRRRRRTVDSSRVSGPETVGGGCEAALMGCSRRCREAKSSSCRCQCGGAGHGGGTVEDMPELNNRQFPEQFHVTTPANAEAIRAGGFAFGGSGGYGKST